jgi:ABC-type enterobactin transport system permease subunit
MNEGWLYATVILGEALLHFLCNTERLLGRKLHPLIAYVLGVAAMMIPFTGWLIEQGQVDSALVAWALWKTIFCAGLSVALSYGVDALIGKIWNDKQKIEQLELQARVNEQGE